MADARTFEYSEYLAAHEIDTEQQRAWHDAAIAHMDDRPFNPYLNTEEVDQRQRPGVELAEKPFGTPLPS